MKCCQSNKIKVLGILIILFGCMSVNCAYSWEGGPVHGHGDDYRGPHGHYHGHEDYHNHRGAYFGWGFPNVVINVPVENYYTPICEDVEVCDFYGECWFEQHCH